MKAVRNLATRGLDAQDRSVLGIAIVLAATIATVVVGGAGLAGLAVRVFSAAVGG